ncbi:phage major capsid protein [Paraburkholderia caribensis]|uniref:Phage major capsid protein n=1 Tax=Paraburkholderia caribensis TaxID=75105 RepID=A0ABV0E3L9_9BURK|nr:phage major capsid protein [Paraburkholderia caribensis]MCO4880517.1 phage major capsid protein [Paraburkholderia caribensis]PTB23787.1 hypothetical protein C9I56_37445 [Paraburkholderia caribensis]
MDNNTTETTRKALIEALIERDKPLAERLQKLKINVQDLGQKYAGRSEWHGGSSTGLSVGETFTKQFDLVEFDRSGRTGKVECTGASIFTKAAGEPTTATFGTAGVPSRALPAYQWVPRLLDVLPSQPFAASAACYPRLDASSFTNAAAQQVTELTPKAQSGLTATPIRDNIPTFAHWARASRQSIDDMAALSAFINAALMTGLRRKIEQAVAQQLAALASPLTQQSGATNLVDLAAFAAAQMDDASRVADTACFNTYDWASMVVGKTSQGEYVFEGDAELAARAGMRTAVSSAVPTGTVVVIDSTCLSVLERMAPLIEMSRFVGDDFIENAIVILCESRCLLAIFDTSGIISAQLVTPPATMKS